MLDILLPDFNSKTVRSQQLRATWTWTTWFLATLALAGLIGLVMLRGGSNPAFIAWLLYLAGVVAILYEPRYGVYLLLCLALMGDGLLTPWYPFVKNFSSAESLLYFSDTAIVSPLESYLGLIFLSWLGRAAFKRNIRFYAGSLLWPALVFTAFITFGLLYGLGTGGNLNIALWEARAIFYLPMMLVLVGNLITKREHVSHLIWTAMIGLFLEGVSGVYFLLVKLGSDLSQVQAITEHAAAIHMNTLFVFVAAVWLYKGSRTKRVVLPLMAPVVGLTYVATQRRAAFLTLAVALALMVLMLYKENRQAFWLITPPLAILGLLYVGIFWNVDSALGMPAQAVKAIVAPNRASAADQSSDYYRFLENINSSFTIQARPLTGVGFGQKFYMLVPLPDISFFVFWEYITHNSIIWIWMKAGVGGFVSMIFLAGAAIMLGVRVLWRMPGGDLSAIALMATLYLVMHFLYAYVDMSWDTQSMVYVGATIGLLNSLEYLVAQPVSLPPKRWPWQPDPAPSPTLLPLTDEIAGTRRRR